MKDRIVVRNARQHNLKGFDLELPRRSLIVITGPSGSGKSSLAFDTIYAEGQRRYVESLSTYAKQFLERMEKPAVDFVDGISPAVAIEQKNPTKTSRSTVGTATEVYDYMRLLWARGGETHCPACDEVVRPDSVQSATDAVLALPGGSRVFIGFPLPVSASGSHARVVESLRALGFVRVYVGGRLLDVSEPGAESPEGLGHDLGERDGAIVVVDRLVVGPEARERLADAFGTAFQEGEGEAVAVLVGGGAGASGASGAGAGDIVLPFTQRFRCPRHPEIRFLDPTPRLFSFNNPYGSCPVCTGFGATLEYDPALIVPDPGRSLRDGAVDPWEKPRYGKYRARLLAFARERGVPVDRPWSELPEEFRDAVIHGTRGFMGVIPFLRSRESKRYKQYIRVFLRQYQSSVTCSACGGARLRPEALRVRVAGRTIAEVNAMTVEEAREWVQGLEGAIGVAGSVGGVGRLDEGDGAAAEGEGSHPGSGEVSGSGPDSRSGSGPGPGPGSGVRPGPLGTILRELGSRLSFLRDVGLGYLTLDRLTRTLSGGEAQRIALANALGSRLVDTLYVLDEPTIGLHPRDTDRLLDLLRQLRAAGNTVLVVEHDPAAILAADHVVELGPGSGERGGHVVFQGDVAALRAADTATAAYLAEISSGRGDAARTGASGAAAADASRRARPGSAPERAGAPARSGGRGAAAVASTRRSPRPRPRAAGPWLEVEGASLHNLRDVDVSIPLGTLTVVTGVSGSGKSTLVHDIVYRNLERILNGESTARQHLGEAIGSVRAIRGTEHLQAVALIDQSPIGRTPRSNPVTYVKAFDHIRQLFASQPTARQRGYAARHFSFNVKGGRCEVCQGAGVVQVEMVFMADVFVPCEACGGARYQPGILDVRIRGLSIRDVLDLTVDEAIRFFIREDRLGQVLWHLQRVGLGYLRLGQPAPTLSGGEAQRLKIARELAQAGRKAGRRLYIMDEPTTGLAGGEVRKLIGVLAQLVEAGHTVLVVEHNLDVIAAADWNIDMGPEAGDAGGRVVAVGPPEEVAAVPESHTGRYLRPYLEGRA